MASIIDILIQASWRGGSATERAQRELRGMGDAADASSKQLRGVARTSDRTGTDITALATKIGVATVAFGGVTLAARQAFRLLEEGAGLALTEQRFDRLAESIGTTGDALLGDLRQATRGMQSDMALMRTATDVVGLGLVDTADEAVRLSRVVSALGANMNEVVLALSNQTTLRFDQIGVAVVGFDERLKELEAQGLSTERAFTEAFLQQAEAQIERVGEAADSTLGPIQQMSANWQNAVDTFKQEFAVRVVEEIDWEQVSEDIGDTAASSAELARALASVVGPLQSLADIGQTIADFPLSPPGFLRFLNSLRDVEAGPANVVRQLAAATGSVEEFTQALARQGQIISNRSGAFVVLNGELVRVEDAYDQLHEQVQLNIAAQEEGRRATDQTTAALGDQADAAADAGSALEAAARAVDIYAQELNKIESFEARREGIDAGDLVSRQRQEQLAADFELEKDRADLFLDFQSDLTSITEREEERRAEITEQHEERRTQIVNDHAQRRAQQEQQLQEDIVEVNQDLAKEEAKRRQEANRDLEKLEEDHLARIQDIINDADAGIEEAASRLRADTVSRIESQRDRAIAKEEESFQRERQRILEQLDWRLQAEQEAAEQRIAELEAFHDKRQREEEQAHQAQLRELDKQHRKQLDQVRDAAEDERRQRERQYTEARMQLGQHWQARFILERDWMNDILRQEEQFWQQRLGLVGGGEAGTVDGGTGGTGSDPAGGGTTGEQPSRWWLEHTAMSVANPDNTDSALAWSQYFRSLSDRELAAWIERHSDIDVPGYRHGLWRVQEDEMLARLHRDEAVLSRRDADAWRSMAAAGGAPAVGSAPRISAAQGGRSVIIEKGAINMPIHTVEGMSTKDVGREVERTLIRVFDRLA